MKMVELKLLLKHETGLSEEQVELFLEKLSNLIIKSVQKGEKVQVTNLGTFKVKVRKGRLGRNLRTGQRMQISEQLTPVFVPSYNFKDIVKGRKKEE